VANERASVIRSGALAAWAALLIGAGTYAPERAQAQVAQQLNPVYVDDSNAGTESLARARELAGSGNLSEAVRVLQILLDDERSRLVHMEGERDMFESVRAAVHRALLKDPALLQRYRTTMQPRAQRLLESGSEGDLETLRESMLLTGAGFEASLRRAQLELEDARFESARQTLEDLEHHPDRAGPAGKDAAELLWQVAGYLDRPALWDEAQGWLNASGASAPNEPGRPRTPVAWPEGATARATSPLDPMDPINRDGLVARPLWTAPVRPEPPGTDPEDEPARAHRPGENSGPDMSALADLNMLPTVANDTVFVNDGSSVMAFDRFTLSPRWAKFTPGDDGSSRADAESRQARDRDFRGWAQRVEDPATVTIDGGRVFAALGRGLSSARNGDAIVSALSARSGEVLWRSTLEKLDPSLKDSGVRGPLVVSEGVVVVTARKFLPERRLMVLFIAGLDARTGERLWVRTVGSAGSLPFVSTSTQFDATVVHEGVAYRMDDLGVAGAYRVRDGEPVWVRAMPREAMQSMDLARAWELAAPIIDTPRRSLIVLTPDRREMLRISMDTGRTIARRSTDAFGSPPPSYLVAAGEMLAAVSRVRVALAPIATFETATNVQLGPNVTPKGITGRVVYAGGRLVLPSATGLTLVNPASPRPAESIELDSPGNLVTIDSQVLTLDDGRLHSYLLWDVAARLLRDRMKADPGDAAPAVTFAELAHRAQRYDQIVPAIDSALGAVKQSPLRPENIQARRRLFGSLNEMVFAGLEPEGAARPIIGPRITDTSTLSQIVDRMALVAVDADERVAQVLASGRLAERRGQFEQAATKYQGVLDAPELAAASWQGPRVSVRADIESTRRLADLVRAHGAGVCAAGSAAAAARLGALGERATLADLRALAEQYPLAGVTPSVWLRISRLHANTDDEQDATGALEAGLRAAARLKEPDPAAVAELSGELLSRLVSRNQFRAAAALLAGIKSRYPAVEPSTGGKPLDIARIESTMAGRLAAQSRWPRIGAMTGANARVLADAVLLEPQLEERTPTTPVMVALESDESVSIWAADSAAPAGGEAAALVNVWSRATKAPQEPEADRPGEGPQAEAAGEPTLIKITGDAAYLAYTDQRPGTIEKVQLVAPGKAQTAWRTPRLDSVFTSTDPALGANRPGQGEARFMVPGEGLVSADDLAVTMDERTIVVVQRSGRAVAFDTDSGRQLWSAHTGVNRVYDADIASGLLVVVGDEQTRPEAGLRGIVQILDARAGRLQQRLIDPTDHPRWVRALESGPLIVAFDASVVSLDPATGRTNWTATKPEAMPAVMAWPIGDTMILQAPDRSLWQLALGSGQIGAEALDGPRTHLEGSRPLSVRPISNSAAGAPGGTTAKAGGAFAVCSFQGLMIYGPDGTLRGVDALGGFESVIAPQLGDGRAITVETVSEGPTTDGQMVFNLYAMETQGARMIETTPITLGARPSSLTLMDGRIILSAGGATVVIEAPAK
jgi:outer membrane protein assembly factor BamB